MDGHNNWRTDDGRHLRAKEVVCHYVLQLTLGSASRSLQPRIKPIVVISIDNFLGLSRFAAAGSNRFETAAR